MRVDDGLEVFKLHGVGGMVGSFMTGIFAQEAGKFCFLNFAQVVERFL